ncbi:MAG: response regulator, partial [Lachnospiraceae bacterium]
FMEQLESSRRAGNIVISIIRMAKLLHIDTVAEGVETKEQKEFLKNIGCDEIQGYYFAKPMAAEDFCSFMMKEPRQQEERTGYQKGVLVVDDVTVIRKSLIQALGDEYIYYEAANGQQALDILKTEASQISIIITDVFMPVMDGFELIRKLQENTIYNHIPIIVVTVSEERENEIKALKLGAVDVITKPYDPVSARHRVKNVLKIAEAERLQMEIKLLNEKNQ